MYLIRKIINLNCGSETEASIYSAFAQNVAMLCMFLVQLFRRNSTRGFSLLGAVCKCVGTFTPTIWGCLAIRRLLFELGRIS